MNLEINNPQTNNINSQDFSDELNNYINQTNFSFSIDRFEGEFAICENQQTGKIISIPKSDLPENAKPGDILKFENGKYVLDLEKTKKEQEIIQNMVSNLFKKKD